MSVEYTLKSLKEHGFIEYKHEEKLSNGEYLYHQDFIYMRKCNLLAAIDPVYQSVVFNKDGMTINTRINEFYIEDSSENYVSIGIGNYSTIMFMTE